MAVKYLGTERLFHGAHGVERKLDGVDLVPGADDSWAPIHSFALRNDTHGRAALARAKTRLSEMAVVGLVERFTESIALLEARVGIQSPGLCVCNVNPFKRHTSAASVGDLTPEATARILKDNALDYELYIFAKDLFVTRLREHNIVASEAGASFACRSNSTYCELSGEHAAQDSRRGGQPSTKRGNPPKGLVTEAFYRDSSDSGRHRIKGKLHHACVFACPRSHGSMK